MKIISTKVHGVLDYLVGVLLIASPWLFNFARGGVETWVPVILGTGAIVYSLLTNYEFRLSRMIFNEDSFNIRYAVWYFIGSIALDIWLQ